MCSPCSVAFIAIDWLLRCIYPDPDYQPILTPAAGSLCSCSLNFLTPFSKPPPPPHPPSPHTHTKHKDYSPILTPAAASLCSCSLNFLTPVSKVTVYPCTFSGSTAESASRRMTSHSTRTSAVVRLKLGST